MSETLIPTHGLRWFSSDAGEVPRLMQRFTTPAGAEVWRDVQRVIGYLPTDPRHPSFSGSSRESTDRCPCGDNDGFPCSLPGCPYAVSTSFDRSAPVHSTEFLEARVNKAYEQGRKHAIEEMFGTNVAIIPKPAFQFGEQVEKHTGDYAAQGEVRGIFPMKNGAIRFVVEHQAEGGGSFCHIYSEKNLRRVG